MLAKSSQVLRKRPSMATKSSLSTTSNRLSTPLRLSHTLKALCSCAKQPRMRVFVLYTYCLFTHPCTAQLEPKLRWHCSYVAWRMHHQGESFLLVARACILNRFDSPSSLTTSMTPTPKTTSLNHSSSTSSSPKVYLQHFGMKLSSYSFLSHL